MSRPVFHRQKLFVNRHVQGRVLAHVAWYWCIYHICLWHGLFLYHYWQYRETLTNGAHAMTSSDLYMEFARTHAGVLIIGAIALPIVLWDMLKMTHRVVGPLVRITAALKHLARGERVHEIQLRRGDYLVGLQDALNEFLRSPFAPQRRTAIASKGDPLAPEIADVQAILDELREIQQSLCREYIPENSHLSAMAKAEVAGRIEPLPFDPHEPPAA